jgi:hypothetical protein
MNNRTLHSLLKKLVHASKPDFLKFRKYCRATTWISLECIEMLLCLQPQGPAIIDLIGEIKDELHQVLVTEQYLLGSAVVSVV